MATRLRILFVLLSIVAVVGIVTWLRRSPPPSRSDSPFLEQIRSNLSRDELLPGRNVRFRFGAPTNGFRFGISTWATDVRFAAHAVVATNHGKELYSLSQKQLGVIELRDDQGRKLRPRDPSLVEPEAYAAFMGGEWAPEHKRQVGLRYCPFTFPRTQMDHQIVAVATNSVTVARGFSITDYFNLKSPGVYVLTFAPRFYVAEHVFQPDDSTPPRYFRVDFPPIVVPVEISEKMLQ